MTFHDDEHRINNTGWIWNGNGTEEWNEKQNHRESTCAARAFCDCPAIISHRPRSQNILKERALNPEKDSRIKRPRSQVSLEKSSQNYKPLEKWAEPNQTSPLTSPPTQASALASVFGGFATWWSQNLRESLAILRRQGKLPRTGERAGWSAVWYNSLTGW